MIRSVACFLLAIFLYGPTLAPPSAATSQFMQSKIGTKNYRLEVADTAARRARGLAQRLFMKNNAGMIFLLPYPAKHNFVMAGMSFPLDFIWLLDNKVIDLTANVPAVANLILAPKEKVNRVIELNAGEISKSGIKIGSIIRLK